MFTVVNTYPSYGYFLEDKREDYQNCAVLCTTIVIHYMHTHMIVLTGELGPVGLGLVSLCVCFVFS